MGVEESREIEVVVDRLALEFPDLSATRIRETVVEVYRSMDGPIRDFVPIFVERRSRDRIRALGSMPTG